MPIPRDCIFLGDGSSVFASTKEAGEDFLRARMIVRDLEEIGTITRDDIPEAFADEVCEAMSCFARSPSCRFYNAWFVSHHVVVECFMKRAQGSSDLPWRADARYYDVVAYAFWNQFIAVGFPVRLQDNESHLKETIRAM